MQQFKINIADLEKIKVNNKFISIIKREKLDLFDESVLGLGKIQNKSETINALCAIFDLEEFTTFCKQIDPQLAIPEYLSEFLKWLFLQIKKQTINKKYPTGYRVWAYPPFYSKFTGDGVLFLWGTDGNDEIVMGNIILSLLLICEDYEMKFLKKIEKKIVSPPTKLRCGIARGIVYSVGDGHDFVGPCINMASRLQKFNSFSFCFSRRGLNPEFNGGLNKDILTLKSEIKGIGNEELICVLRDEFDSLPAIEKKYFQLFDD